MRIRKSLVAMVGLFVVGGSLSAYAARGLSSEDKKFMMEAASGGLMEVQLGQVAQEKGQAQDVKNFGMRMVTDHGRANDELTKIAQQKHVKLPTQPKENERSMAEKLAKQSGAEFDKKYMYEMVKDHVKDVAAFRSATGKVKDLDLNTWAGKTLPVLEQHLQQARNVAEKVGVDVKQAEREGQKEVEKKEKHK